MKVPFYRNMAWLHNFIVLVQFSLRLTSHNTTFGRNLGQSIDKQLILKHSLLIYRGAVCLLPLLSNEVVIVVWNKTLTLLFYEHRKWPLQRNAVELNSMFIFRILYMHFWCFIKIKLYLCNYCIAPSHLKSTEQCKKRNATAFLVWNKIKM